MEKQYTKEQLLTHLRHTNPTMYKLVTSGKWGAIPTSAVDLPSENFQQLIHEISPIDNGLQLRPESDYKKALKRIRDEGIWVENKRTGTKCKTLINIDLTYKADDFPLDTSRKSYWKGAIAELLGFIRGYTNAADFRALGAKTWDANANENEAWLNNPNRRGEDDMGLVYGAIANNLPVMGRSDNGELVVTGYRDTLAEIVSDLIVGNDNRGEIWTFWSPSMENLGCLRSCMHTHHFSLLDGKLHLNSTSRSWDGLLGGNYNSVQCYVLLALMAQITGHEQGNVYHKVVNAHIYDNQWDTFIESKHADRGEFPAPKLWINPEIKTLEDLRTWVTLADFDVIGYEHHDAISYPMTA